MHISLKNKFLYFYNYKIKCSIGKRGLTSKKKEGDLKTPKGRFKFEFLLFRKDRIKKIYSKLKKIKISKNMGWCDDSGSSSYNRLVKFPFKKSAEKLFLKKRNYDLILVINFNRKPVIKNRGSAIFLHLIDKRFSPTKGCIAIKKKDFIKILPLITKKTKLFIY
tara:strand:+ start:2087 stop:2578 length:492 start_codon:yes stop_codon:yes gene_type:complete